MSHPAENDAPLVVNITTGEWLAQLAHAWDLGHLSLCRRHGKMPFEACQNPYRATSKAPSPGGFCERHWSWLCQAGQGQCGRIDADIHPSEENDQN